MDQIYPGRLARSEKEGSSNAIVCCEMLSGIYFICSRLLGYE
ncbi:MAG: hypothetical protein ACYDEF_06460 [Methanosarcina sp.]